VRAKPGLPRLEEKNDGFLDAIKAAAIHGSASHERRQTDEIKCCKTLDELKSTVEKLFGMTISRSVKST